MTRIIVKFLLFLAGVLLPLITLNFSLLDVLGYQALDNGQIHIERFGLGFTGTKPQVELQLRLIFSVAVAVFALFYDLFEYVLPRRDFKEFRALYLNTEKDTWRTQLDKQVNGQIRINLMHLYRPWWTLFLFKAYRWTWNDGFAPPNEYKDANMRLLKHQGACGKAVRHGKAQAVDLRGNKSPGWILWLLQWILPLNQFFLFRYQIHKTKNLKFVLCMPILKASKDLSKKHKVVGVINLDTGTDEGADFLKQNKETLITYFEQYSEVLATLR